MPQISPLYFLDLTMACRGIKYVSLYEASGYGLAAHGYISGLLEAGFPVTWTPVTGGHRWSRFYYQPFSGPRIGDPLLDPICNKRMEYDKVLLHLTPEYIPFWRKREPEKILIGYSVWETSHLPRHWPDLLNQLNALLVPCQWNREVFAQSGVRIPIHVIPHLLEEAPQPSSQAFVAECSDRFVFYGICPWTARKAPWNTIRAYLETFTAGDPVLLLLKTSRQDFTRGRLGQYIFHTGCNLRKLMARYKNPAPVMLVDRTLSRNSMMALHARGDCFVSLCHSEGWGLGSFEAAALGNPVLITNYGGQVDYLSPDLSYLVDSHLVPVQDRNGRGSYTSDQQWAEPSLAHASKLMREIFEDPQKARVKANALAQEIQKRFNRRRVTGQLIDRINAA
jgi:glycosyltransferase involved in cell wall biosynthesis